MQSRTFCLVALAMLFSPGWTIMQSAFAQNPIQWSQAHQEGRAWVEDATCTVPVREGGRLTIRSDFGTIHAQSGNNNRLDCRVRLRAYTPDESAARREFGRFELTVSTYDQGSILIAGRLARGGRSNRIGADFDVTTPRAFNLDLETEGGGITVENLDGELRARTAGGDVRTGDVSGPVRINTAGGEINLGNIGDRLEAQTAGGNIRVGDVKGDATLETSGGGITAGRIQGTVRAQTAGGDIVLRGASGPVIAETSGGQIQIGNCGASIRAQTAGGSIHLQGARGMVDAQTAGGNLDLFQLESAVRAETADGAILAEINASRNTFDASRLETSVGDIQVYLPPDLPLTINAAIRQAFGRKIVSDFPIEIRNSGKEFSHRSQVVDAPLNGGGKLLNIETEMGNISIHKLDIETIQQLQQREKEFWDRWQARQQGQEKKPHDEN